MSFSIGSAARTQLGRSVSSSRSTSSRTAADLCARCACAGIARFNGTSFPAAHRLRLAHFSQSASRRGSTPIDKPASRRTARIEPDAAQAHRSGPSPRPHRDEQSRWPRRTLAAFLAATAAILFEQDLYSVATIAGESMSPTLNPTAESQVHSGKADHVLLNRWAAKTRRLRRGDIVFLQLPSDPDYVVCKRILALEGDIVRIRAKEGNRFPSDSSYTRSRAPVPSSLSASASSAVQDPSVGRDLALTQDEEDELDLEFFGRQPPARPGGTAVWKLIRIPQGHAWVEGDASATATGLGREPTNPGQGWSAGKSRDSREYGPVSLNLITGRVDFIWWPGHRIGQPAKRPELEVMRPVNGVVPTSSHAARAVYVRRRPAVQSSEAHPDDSPISPYVLDSAPSARP